MERNLDESEVEECVCGGGASAHACMFPDFGWQLSDFLSDVLANPAGLQREIEVTVG